MTAHTTRRDDWQRFACALLGYPEPRRHRNPVLNYVLLVLHTGKNIVVEEARRQGFELRPSKR